MSTEQKRAVRCAMYTRKSSEEGLDQTFNSLHAQREACEAYILSQLHEGWRALDTHYDDGGFSGGSLERPAVKRLLADVESKKIDTVVVYKVDRLTRNLADFAKIIEAFDARGVSFVSVTQQFNTTSSMGRLTLNVLLSFAQFEREVTGERIRDKIAASKRKGMWMGGRVPLGYDLLDRRLVVNPEEAERVREIYRLYLKLGCVRRLKQQLDKREIKSKIRVSRTGKSSGGASYSRGSLYELLQNPLYVGETRHKKQVFPGEHEAIMDRELWSKVGAKLKENAVARRHGTNASAPSLFRGLLFDEQGNRFTPSHAVKNGKRYRYYISQKVIKEGVSTSNGPTRIPAREIEQLVLTRLKSFFASAEEVISALVREEDDVAITRALIEGAQRSAESLNEQTVGNVNEMLATAVFRITVLPEAVEVQLGKNRLRSQLLHDGRWEYQAESHGDSLEEEVITLTIGTNLRRCGRAGMRLIIPAGARPASKTISPFLKAVCRAHEWVRLIEQGKYKDQRAIASATGLDERYISRILPSAFLAPEMVQAIVEGRQDRGSALNDLRHDMPLSWARQRQNCQGRSKTKPVQRSKSRPVDGDEVVEYVLGKGLWSVAEEALSQEARQRGVV